MAIALNIQQGDVVRHRLGGATHRVSSVGGLNTDSPTILISKDGEGAVFSGSLDQARAQGFAFGSEDFMSNALTIANYSLADGIEAAEKAILGEGELRDIARFAATAGIEVQKLQERLSEKSIAESQARQALTNYQVEVRTAIIDAQQAHDLCREGTNKVLEELGLDTITPTWSVRVRRDDDGTEIAVITGVEADTRFDAEAKVESDFHVTAEVNAVTYKYDYYGDGEAEFDEHEYEEDGLDDDDDDYASNHGLSFSATEE